MKKILLLLIIFVPTFFRLFQPGLYSMQDFPYFRVVEYHECLSDNQFPCRWAPDAGLGYGEPVFNFYSHVPFLTGAALISVGFSAINSLKILFALSLLLSGLGMYLLSKKLWGNEYSAFLSAVLYVYAPYRAVNVWVRGALPESFAFIFLPFILLVFEYYLSTRKQKWLLALSAVMSLLILTHNLSVLLFAPLIGVYILIRLIQTNSLRLLFPLIISFVFSLFLSAFYLIPAIVEAPLVNLQTTTLGYFDFRAHFVTIPQLFISRFWGYGGSTWGDQDGLSLSIGQIQWIISAIIIFSVVLRWARKKVDSKSVLTISLLTLSAFFLFLTHNKSAFLWEFLSSFMKYIQFPWRFLGVSLFSLSLAAGYLPFTQKRYRKGLVIVAISMTVILNISFFREDIWRKVTDETMQTGETWIDQTRASIGDYWPKYGPIPTEYVKNEVDIVTLKHSSNYLRYEVNTNTLHRTNISLPVAYYPGWTATVNAKPVSISFDSQGFISIPVKKGDTLIELHLENTDAQQVGNIISLAASIMFITTGVLLFLKNKK